MKTKIILISSILVLAYSCKKDDMEAQAWATEVEHLSKRWKVQNANKNSTGMEENNYEDVTYDWTQWSVEFWINNAYRIIEYSPDSSVCIIESGTWQLNSEGEMLLRGSENLIEFSTGTIIDEGETERIWQRKRNQNNEFWIWIEESYYGTSGVFLKMVPY